MDYPREVFQNLILQLMCFGTCIYFVLIIVVFLYSHDYVIHTSTQREGGGAYVPRRPCFKK